MRTFKPKSEFTFIPPFGRVSGIIVGDQWGKYCPSLLEEIFTTESKTPVVHVQQINEQPLSELKYETTPKINIEPIVIQPLPITFIDADKFNAPVVINENNDIIVELVNDTIDEIEEDAHMGIAYVHQEESENTEQSDDVPIDIVKEKSGESMSDRLRKAKGD